MRPTAGGIHPPRPHFPTMISDSTRSTFPNWSRAASQHHPSIHPPIQYFNTLEHKPGAGQEDGQFLLGPPHPNAVSLMNLHNIPEPTAARSQNSLPASPSLPHPLFSRHFRTGRNHGFSFAISERPRANRRNAGLGLEHCPHRCSK